MHCVSSMARLCVTLCDSMDWSTPGSPVHGILQARILEWVACPPPGDLSNPGIKPESLMSPALSGSFFITSATWKVLSSLIQTANSQWLSILHMVVCSFHTPLSFPPLPAPHVHKSAVYVCVSAAALQIGLSVTSF